MSFYELFNLLDVCTEDGQYESSINIEVRWLHIIWNLL